MPEPLQLSIADQTLAVPPATVPFLVELAGIIDGEKPGLAGAIERHRQVLAAAARHAGEELDLDRLPVTFEELDGAVAQVMRHAGFNWGKAMPAQAGFPTDSTS